MTTRRPKVPKVTSVGRGHLGNADHEALNVGGFANSISFVVLVRGGNGTPSVSEGPRLPSRGPSLTLGVPFRMAGCPRRRMPLLKLDQDYKNEAHPEDTPIRPACGRSMTMLLRQLLRAPTPGHGAARASSGSATRPRAGGRSTAMACGAGDRKPPPRGDCSNETLTLLIRGSYGAGATVTLCGPRPAWPVYVDLEDR